MGLRATVVSTEDRHHARSGKRRADLRGKRLHSGQIEFARIAAKIAENGRPWSCYLRMPSFWITSL